LTVGGWFSIAGDKVAGYVAQWTKHDFICGDVDGDGLPVNISDLVYLVDYMFTAGPPPPNMEMADVDGSGDIDISDLVYLVDYMFNGGPEPVCP
ncbi:MAG: dockerin type I repeat-containing protein, partial [candidate division Zixibacteria bacterium]|nr:dockerin type I repeat-containing protein [candidate division Zixibacteria bacterium]